MHPEERGRVTGSGENFPHHTIYSLKASHSLLVIPSCFHSINSIIGSNSCIFVTSSLYARRYFTIEAKFEFK